ncbi:hypothetical protein Tco_1267013 [Tanacetum coccineum]
MQPVAAASALEAPQPPHAATSTRTMAQRLIRLDEEVHSLRGDMGKQREVLDSLARDFSQFTARMVTSLSLMMDRSGDFAEKKSTIFVEYL